MIKRGYKFAYIGENSIECSYGDELTLMDDLSIEAIHDIRSGNFMGTLSCMYFKDYPCFRHFEIKDLMPLDQFIIKKRDDLISDVLGITQSN